MEGHLRGIIGQLTVEQIVKEPEMVGERMRATCAEDMSKMGLEVISFTIKEVRDKNEYISNMGRPDVARIKRDAEMATADAERDTAIKRATALRESAVAKAQADQRGPSDATFKRCHVRPRGLFPAQGYDARIKKWSPNRQRYGPFLVEYLRQLGKRDHQGEAEGRGDEQGGVEHDRSPFFGSDVSPLTKIVQFGCQFRRKLNPPDHGDESEYPKRHRHEFGIVIV